VDVHGRHRDGDGHPAVLSGVRDPVLTIVPRHPMAANSLPLADGRSML
jgi:hypothetical protein